MLARHLRTAARTLPAVVVSRATGTNRAYVDVDGLRRDLAGIADVFEITTLDASWAFSKSVPARCQVYGGASRTYPLGTSWVDDPYLSPLRFAYSTADGSRVTRELIADALGMASTGELSLPAAADQARPVTGEVAGVVGDRALVRLPNQQLPGVVWPELVEPGLPAERLFAKRMVIQGVFDPEYRRIDVRGMRQAPLDAVAGYPADSTILVRVASVSAQSCTVELFPGLRVDVPGDLVVDDGTDLRTLMVAGEVLPAWFGGKDESSGEWLLSLLDADDPGEAVPAAAVLVGGPPWLVPSDTEPAQPATEDAQPPPVAAIVAEPSTQLVAALQQERDQLGSQLSAARNQVRSLKSELDAARRDLRELKRRRARSGAPEQDDSQLFDNEADQLSFEIRLAWARMTQPGEKKRLALKPWSYGEQFFDTLQEVEGISRDKIVEVLVHVLTGRDAELASRELHLLRTGRGGGDPVVMRNNGQDRCWRVSLQVRTPSARRLHYWDCSDSSIELGSIRVHDDFRP